jgi:hypothetical protein
LVCLVNFMGWTGVGPFSDFYVVDWRLVRLVNFMGGLGLVRLVKFMEWTGVGLFSEFRGVDWDFYGVDWGWSV